MKRIVTAVASLLVIGASIAFAPAARSDDIAGYGMNALAVGMRYQFNSPGFLPTGDPAKGEIADFDVPIARTGVSAGPVINAIASPLYPGDTAAHLGTALATFGVPIPVPNYPIVAEANYPPTPDKGSSASFGQGGLGEGTAETSAQGAKVVARTVEQVIEGAVGAGSSVTRNDVTIADDSVRAVATSATSTITIAGIITIEGVIGRAEAVSNGVNGKPGATLEIGKVTAAGQAAYIDQNGVHVVTAPILGEGVVAGVQQMVNGVLETDGIKIRTIAPTTSVNGAGAAADAGALAISIDRMIPATGVPGVPALDIPGVATIVLGTPDLPSHIDVLIGTARAGVDATTFSLGGLELPPIDVGGVDFTNDDGLGDITGAGASLEGALTSPPLSETGQADLGFQPTADVATGKGIPVGWIIVGIFGAFAFSGPLLGYARWQLLEGRHR